MLAVLTEAHMHFGSCSLPFSFLGVISGTALSHVENRSYFFPTEPSTGVKLPIKVEQIVRQNILIVHSLLTLCLFILRSSNNINLV